MNGLIRIDKTFKHKVCKHINIGGKPFFEWEYYEYEEEIIIYCNECNKDYKLINHIN